MDKVEYLKKYQQARRRFDEIMQKLLLLQDERQTITGTLGGEEIHSTDVKSRVETLALNISDKQEQLIAAAEKMIAVQDQVEQTINRVQDVRLRIILHSRYINGLTWQAVALAVGVDYVTAWRLHKKALEAVELPDLG